MGGTQVACLNASAADSCTAMQGMARRRPSSALETRLGSWARLLPPGLLLLLASARALEANHTERAAADSAVEVLVRTFLKRCGRNGLCQDPSLGDYYYRWEVRDDGSTGKGMDEGGQNAGGSE